MKQKYGYLIVFLIALVGCGGGGSSSKTPEQVNTAPQLIGLIDFAIDENTTEIYTLSLHDALPIYKNVESVFNKTKKYQNCFSSSIQNSRLFHRHRLYPTEGIICVLMLR